MQELKKIETHTLIDMLSQYTSDYTTLIVQKGSNELEQYEYDIAMIQAELNSRTIPWGKSEHPAGTSRGIRRSNGPGKNH